jgi:hypothetical protein
MKAYEDFVAKIYEDGELAIYEWCMNGRGFVGFFKK